MKSFNTADFQEAKAKHLQFKSRLRAILYDELPEQESKTVLSQYACAVGKWIYSHALIDYEDIPEVHELEQVHASLHVVARNLVKQHQQGYSEEARYGLTRIEQIADRLVELLHSVEEKVIVSSSDGSAIKNDDQDTILKALLAKNELLDAKIKAQVETAKKANVTIENERQVLHEFFMQAPAAHCILRGPTHIFELANSAYLELVGGRDVVGMTVREALPELKGQGFYELLDSVFTMGEPFVGKEILIILDNGQGIPKNAYLNFIYQPIKDEQGQVDGILVFAYEVTEQVMARQIVEESEARFRYFIQEAPVAMLVYVGPDMVMQEANEKMLEIFGRGDAVLGKPLLETVPELKETALPERYRKVLATGETHYQYAERILLVKNGQSYWGYYDYTYKALRDSEGTIYGVICTAVDVTDQVLARQKVEESEALFNTLANSIDQLAWIADAGGWIYWYNERWYAYTGTTQEQMQGWGWQAVHHPDHLEHVVTFVQKAWQGNEPYELTFPLRAKDGQFRRFLTRVYPIKDQTGRVMQWVGTNTDIEEQKQIEANLEQLVQERTEALGATNEELAASNKELTEANDLLIRSNDNLQKFAYVASHDLQEPLRKIQQFGDLLKNRYEAPSDEASVYLDRMQSAANRMSSLIRDLLTFSRISTQRDMDGMVSLTEVVQVVQSDLELVIEETRAVVTVAPLPMVLGDASQLGQLFQNLLANALKFHRVDRSGVPIAPLVQISSQTVASRDLPPSIKPTRSAFFYHRIDIADNGIGFDEKYLDRIFQVFQRLHGKNEFAGTGIGLAISEKVVTNHGGAITATSQPGQGTTFHIYFPVIENQ